MNFFDATLTGAGEEMAVEAQNLRVKLPPERSMRVAQFSGKRVTLGIRPEDIHDPRFLPATVRGQPVDARVDVTEMMGAEKFLHLFAGTEKLLARVDPRTAARAGQEARLLFDVDRVHIFDFETQVALDKIEIPEEILGTMPGGPSVPLEAPDS
jgi:multiple sugar transport system ATP-binding protein